MLKLGSKERGHFVTLIENRVHLISVNPEHNYCLFVCVDFLKRQ